MIKIEGLDKLQRELEEARSALGALDEDLGSVNFNPHDPASIEAAVQSIYQMIDASVGSYKTNPLISSVVEQLKEHYREGILQKAAEVRLQANKAE